MGILCIAHPCLCMQCAGYWGTPCCPVNLLSWGCVDELPCRDIMIIEEQDLAILPKVQTTLEGPQYGAVPLH